MENNESKITVNYDNLSQLTGLPDMEDSEANVNFYWSPIPDCEELDPDDENVYMTRKEIEKYLNIPPEIMDKYSDASDVDFIITSGYTPGTDYYVDLSIYSADNEEHISLLPDDRLKETFLNMTLAVMKDIEYEDGERLTRGLLQAYGFPVDKSLTAKDVDFLSHTSCIGDDDLIARLNDAIGNSPVAEESKKQKEPAPILDKIPEGATQIAYFITDHGRSGDECWTDHVKFYKTDDNRFYKEYHEGYMGDTTISEVTEEAVVERMKVARQDAAENEPHQAYQSYDDVKIYQDYEPNNIVECEER